ncbi:MAG TPA: hypothetical protein VMU25_01685 [Candidatus Paceibacterota bacterium]|nr:hypothetical protein [Candidatus Paceibacterota bacterium]
MSVGDVVGRFTDQIINPALLILAAAGFMFFVWGLVEFLISLIQGGQTGDGKRHMIYGVLGMVIMFSTYGIISLLNNTFGLNAFSGPDTSRIQNVNPSGNFFSQ